MTTRMVLLFLRCLLLASVVESWVLTSISSSRSIINLQTTNTDDDRATMASSGGGDIICSSRKDFIMATTTTATTAFIGGGIMFPPSMAQARGRATLEQAYDRYVPRIVAGGEYYARDLRSLIERNDWSGLAQATAEPPPKSKEDRSKPDGGVADRLAKAGKFSNAIVVTACDLFAGAFSDSTISAKTKQMREQAKVLRDVVTGLNTAAREALGEIPSSSSGGLLFGFGGGKKPSTTELAKQVRALYVKGGNAWNQYIFAANDGLPIQYKKLPYLK